MKKLGLIGYPLSHSFSKKYFEDKFENENIKNYSYKLFELKELEEFVDLIKNNPDIEGLNVTIPYKEKILNFVDEVDEMVKKIGAANTLKIKNGKIKAFNTDIIGFEKSFIPLLRPYHKKALILGTGGASKAVSYVLKKYSIPHLFVSREKMDSDTIRYQNINNQLLKEYKIIINTTPVGTYPNINEKPKIPYHLCGKEHFFYDLIYNPGKTRFLKEAEKKGATLSNGLNMLKLQAEEAWKIWTDKN